MDATVTNNGTMTDANAHVQEIQLSNVQEASHSVRQAVHVNALRSNHSVVVQVIKSGMMTSAVVSVRMPIAIAQELKPSVKSLVLASATHHAQLAVVLHQRHGLTDHASANAQEDQTTAREQLFLIIIHANASVQDTSKFHTAVVVQENTGTRQHVTASAQRSETAMAESSMTILVNVNIHESFHAEAKQQCDIFNSFNNIFGILKILKIWHRKIFQFI